MHYLSYIQFYFVPYRLLFGGLFVELVELCYQVRRKDFWLLSTVTKLLKEFIPRLSHDADGLIFQLAEDQKC
jgi:hypothetical protein